MLAVEIDLDRAEGDVADAREAQQIHFHIELHEHHGKREQQTADEPVQLAPAEEQQPGEAALIDREQQQLQRLGIIERGVEQADARDGLRERDPLASKCLQRVHGRYQHCEEQVELDVGEGQHGSELLIDEFHRAGSGIHAHAARIVQPEHAQAQRRVDHGPFRDAQDPLFHGALK